MERHRRTGYCTRACAQDEIRVSHPHDDALLHVRYAKGIQTRCVKRRCGRGGKKVRRVDPRSGTVKCLPALQPQHQHPQPQPQRRPGLRAPSRSRARAGLPVHRYAAQEAAQMEQERQAKLRRAAARAANVQQKKDAFEQRVEAFHRGDENYNIARARKLRAHREALARRKYAERLRHIQQQQQQQP